MNNRIPRRTLVRLVSYAAAFLLILSALTIINVRRADAAELKLEYQYLKNVDDLSTHMQNVDSTLLKAMYSGSSSTLTSLSSKIWRDTGFAKECLTGLPISYLNLENTYKFLSQLGDYTQSLSGKMERGGTITAEERDNLVKFKEYSDQFLQEILAVQDGIKTGSISLAEVNSDIASQNADITAASFGDGFQEFESGFTAYPSLIYDGPFSDNAMKKEPEMTKSAPEVTEAQALAAANQALPEPRDLKKDHEAEGTMPAYCFSDGTATIGVTKNGGYINYIIIGREIDGQVLGTEDGIKHADDFLQKMKITDMKRTYHEISGGIMTINYAAVQGENTLYTDLIKVSVAMDNGEIVRFDARGYLTNHKERTDLTPALTRETAQREISSLLTVEKSSLCVIPSEGTEELFCYEFKCKTTANEDVLVYVNAKTGREEQILILYQHENGSLTI